MSDDVGARLAASALGAGVAESVTLPTDVAKVRLQVQQTGATGARYNSTFDCLRKIAAEEGPRSLWKGYTPALTRQICYTSLSFVIYEPVRNFYASFGKAGQPPNFAQRLAAGGTAGAAAISVFNPTEVVKTQIQTATETVTMREVISKVWKNEGLFGFWAGVKPNIARTFLVNAAELGTYDEAKFWLSQYFTSPLATHVSSSTVAGFASACTSTPADVVKTRLMNTAGGAKQYSGMIHAGTTILKDEGITALYKGFTPILVRKTIWCTVFFVTYERIRAQVNRQSSGSSEVVRISSTTVVDDEE